MKIEHIKDGMKEHVWYVAVNDVIVGQENYEKTKALVDELRSDEGKARMVRICILDRSEDENPF